MKNLLAFLILIISIEAKAEYVPENNSTLFGMGLVGASAGGFGANLFVKRESNWGFYLDFVVSGTKQETVGFNRYTAESVFNDQFKGSSKYTSSIGLGTTYGITEHIFAVGALSFGSTENYRNYNDRYGILGKSGDYFVKDESSSTSGASFGAIFHPFGLERNRVNLTLIYNTTSKLIFGLGYVF